MSAILKGKIFGMPRWVFFILLAVGLAVGLYLRSRSSPVEDAVTDEEAEDYGGEAPLDAVDEPGLAGAIGVASPPGGVYPVTTPMIPEGLTDVFGVLGGVIEGQGATIAELGAIRFPDAIAQPEAQPATAPTTGGGPPKRPASTVRKAPSKKEARRRVQSIAKRHGSRSKEAARARKRLGIKPPPPRKKRKRR